jgi:hypothetical protein
MSKRKYPRLGYAGKVKHKTDCSACLLPGTHKIEIQINWFRGDDDVYYACPDHLAMLRTGNIKQFCHQASEKQLNAGKVRP